MSDVLVAEKLTPSLDEVPQYESSYKEGDIGELRVYLQDNLTEEQVRLIEHEIIDQGVILIAPITQDSRILIIHFRKAIAPLIIIVGAISAIGTGILGWQMWKGTKYGIPIWAWGVLAGGILVYLLSSNTGKKAMSYGITYATKGAIR